MHDIWHLKLKLVKEYCVHRTVLQFINTIAEYGIWQAKVKTKNVLCTNYNTTIYTIAE